MLGEVVADDGRLVGEVARVVAQVAVDEARLVHGAVARQAHVEHRCLVRLHVHERTAHGADRHGHGHGWLTRHGAVLLTCRCVQVDR